ncbi:chitobiase/beta-hexosaminidase C-terminal domain-containing protein [bacterium]|nr:chitobiase/beta-hexosaminidase C-terminal domain-containing protein [bacterium]
MRKAKRSLHRSTCLLGALFVSGLAVADSPVANVVFYDSDPLTTDDPYAIVAHTVPGYTESVGVYDGFSVEVQTSDTDALLGFLMGTPQTVNQELPLPADQYHISVNQVDSRRSLAFFGSVGVYDPLGVRIDPPQGSYQTTQPVTFVARDATAVIKFSIDGAPFEAYTGQPIYITGDTTIEYQGETLNVTGPLKAATYDVQFPDCLDQDADQIPDRLEVELTLNPLEPEGDANDNGRNDFDEVIRGATTIAPMSIAPLFVDTDGDNWSDYDETLRGTADDDAEDFPAAPSLSTVEIHRTGTISDSAAGGTPPPGSPTPGKPTPTNWSVQVITPGGTAAGSPHDSDGTFDLRTSGEQFRYYQALALDGSGRQLLAVQSPKTLCIDTMSFCADASDLNTWVTSYRTAYEAAIYDEQANALIDPRTTAEALLLNRYYELQEGDGAIFVPGEAGKGPAGSLVSTLAAGRDEVALYADVSGAVTTEMIDLVADYFRFYTTPQSRSMMELLSDHFAGRPVDAEDIPQGVRTANIAPVETQVDAFFNALPPGWTELSGTITHDEFGFLLDVGGDTYRLRGLVETFVDGTPVVLRTIIDRDHCGGDPLHAFVTEVVSRGLAPLPPINDSDNDTLDDDWEFFYFGNLNQNQFDNPDGDGLNNGEEQDNGNNPLIPDDVIRGIGWMLY